MLPPTLGIFALYASVTLIVYVTPSI